MGLELVPAEDLAAVDASVIFVSLSYVFVLTSDCVMYVVVGYCMFAAAVYASVGRSGHMCVCIYIYIYIY